MTDLEKAARLVVLAFEAHRTHHEHGCVYLDPAIELLRKVILEAEQPAQQEPVTVLPDGSAFAVMSYPLPKNHWLYADRQYNDGEYEPVELGKPILTHELSDVVVSAVRYAIRGATNCGKEMDFDPDALVQNAVYALCGPFTSTQPAKQCDDCNGMGIQDGKGDKCLSCDGHGEQTASKPNDCARSHPHENMDAMCELRTEIARLTNENARLKAEQQEPVGQLMEEAYGRGQVLWFNKPHDFSMLYTSPQRKPWVSLTDKEIKRMAAPWFLSMYWSLCNTFAREIEAKLKEKNT